MPQLFIKDFGDAIVQHIRDHVTDLAIDGLESDDIDWARAINSEPVYVMNPLVALPLVKIRFINLNTVIGPQGRLECEYEYSVMYFKKQTIGEDHQELLVADIEKIAELFSNDPNLYRIPIFVDVGNSQSNLQQLNQIWPGTVNMFPELKHTIDSPNTRISVAEIRLGINSWSFRS